MTELSKIISAILAAAGGAAAITWLILSKFGDHWLAQKFEKQLQAFKHEQAKEIEQVRHRIASLFSRISKIHEKEFEVLPAAWLKLHQAYGSLFQLIVALKQFPDLKQMPLPQFEEFVSACRLPTFRKNELLQATDRDEYYRRWIWWADFSDAKTAHTEINNYLVMNSIFMTQALRRQFGEINNLLSSVLIAEEIGRSASNTELARQAAEDFKKIQPLLSSLETAIQERLHYDEA